MQVTLARADVAYQSFFKRPLLDRQDGTPALIQTVYDALSDNFTISLADVVFNQSGGPADNAVTIKLFGAAASIELRSEFWKGSFPRVVTPDDFKLVLRCLSVISEAIAKTSSDRCVPSRVSVGLAGWYKVTGGFDHTTFFSGLGSKAVELEPDFLGSKSVEYTFNPSLKNGDEGWDATFLIQASLIAETELFMKASSNYVSGGRYGSLELQAEHAERLVLGMLEKLGFEAIPMVVTGG
jgi:hypothetical protein